MLDAIPPITPQQNEQAVNNPLQDRSAPKTDEKPHAKPESSSRERPKVAEARNAVSPQKAEAVPPDENKPKENTTAENKNLQEAQNDQGNKQRGNTLDIMA